MLPYAKGQAVLAYSQTESAWVDATILEVLPDTSVRIQYGHSHKLVPLELQATILKHKAGDHKEGSLDLQTTTLKENTSEGVIKCSYDIGQAVEIFSKSQNQWVPGAVRNVLPDGSAHVQYSNAQHLYKVVPLQMQATLLRAASSVPLQTASPDCRDVAPWNSSTLLTESDQLRAKVLEQQKQLEELIEAQRQQQLLRDQQQELLLQQQKQLERLREQQPSDGGVASVVSLRTPPEVKATPWSCKRCTFENEATLQDCEACGADRHSASKLPAVASTDARGPNAFSRRCPRCTFENIGRGSCELCGASLLETSAAGKNETGLVARTDGGVRRFIPPSFPVTPTVQSRAAAPVMEAEELVEIPMPAAAAASASSSCAKAQNGQASATPQLLVPKGLHDHLRPYQREGVAWMWRLYHEGHGGILADDMGLGKTVQACGLLRCIRRLGATQALILVPVTLLDQWAREVHRWCPECQVFIYHGSKEQRARALREMGRANGGVLLTSYAIAKNEDLLLFAASARASTFQQEPTLEQGGRIPPGWLSTRKRALDEAFHSAQQRPWDLVICDEAHVMRTISTLLGRNLRRISARCRLLLTGTPVQNALQDLWALMDFAQPGLLGNHVTFVKRFNDPIEKGSVRGASTSAVALKRHLCEQLLQLITPHLLRRTKESVGLAALPAPASAAAAGGTEASASLPPKVETVVWLTPTKEQIKTYKKVLETSDVIREANSKSKLGVEVFRAIGLLKRIANHPALGLPLSLPGDWEAYLAGPARDLPATSAGEAARAGARGRGRGRGRGVSAAVAATAAATIAKGKATKGESKRGRGGSAPAAVALDGELANGEPEAAQIDGQIVDEVDAGKAVEKLLANLPTDLESVVGQSAKLRCLAAMLPALISRGHWVLVFSQGVKMMDLVELCILQKQGIQYLRIDGKTDTAARAESVEKFQRETHMYKCLLLTTRVGGYGLNLTGADRVILLDPAWNPATDMQAVDRAYRIGQDKEVRTYRLVMSGLIEDKMFRLQVFKMGLTRTALETRQQHRYFTAAEIRGLFEWTDPTRGETRRLLLEKHGKADDEAAALNARVDGANEGWLKAGPALGLSNFATIYSSLAPEEEEEDDEGDPQISEMRAKLRDAELNAERTAEARQSLEGALESAQLGAMEEARQIAAAASERSKAAKALQAAQQELQEAKRQAIAAERQVEKTAQEEASVQKRAAAAEDHLTTAAAAAATAEAEVTKAMSTTTEAERSLAQTFEEVDGRLAAVRNGPIAATACDIATARRALERARKACEAAHACYNALQEASEGMLRARSVETEANVIVAECSITNAGDVKAAQAAQRAAAKEHAVAEKAFEKAQARSDTAQNGAAQTITPLRDAFTTFADALQGGAAAKATSRELKAAARGIMTAWQAVRAARDACNRIGAVHRKAAQNRDSAAAACKEARARATATELSLRRAAAEFQSLQDARSARETDAEAAKAAAVTSEAREAGHKRKREEQRTAVDEAKRSLKLAKVAEKEASLGRQNLYKHYAKAGDKGVKQELDAARTSAEEQAKAISAVEALRAEEYDANQVVVAYEAKHKPRAEGE